MTSFTHDAKSAYTASSGNNYWMNILVITAEGLMLLLRRLLFALRRTDE